MRRFATLFMLVAVVAGCTTKQPIEGDAPSPVAPTSDEEATSSLRISRGHVRAFPGGGTILYQAQLEPTFPVAGIGMVSSDGTVRQIAAGDFAYWDPASQDRRLLVVRQDDDPEIRVFELEGDRASVVEGWPADDGLFATFSRDGRWIADVPSGRRGRPRTGSVVLTDRSTGLSRMLRPSHELTWPEWLPDGRLVAHPASGGRAVLVDPRSEHTQPLPGPIAWLPWGFASWSPKGDAVAAAFCCDRSNAIRLFTSGGHPIARVAVGTRHVSLPTWSPDGTRLAYVVRGRGRTGHRHARLEILEVASGRTQVVRRDVSDAFWASWSPDGRWLVLDDWTRERWLFVRADGTRAIRYPWLGGMPRWCCPSSPGIEVHYPVG